MSRNAWRNFRRERVHQKALVPWPAISRKEIECSFPRCETGEVLELHLLFRLLRIPAKEHHHVSDLHYQPRMCSLGQLRREFLLLLFEFSEFHFHELMT